ncbi:hypothetical protein BDV96DRAFT_657660 [Lophiotrema nucula]|uniref:Uncharacterized protein n=1 Tax=Lophiotrema nucula TaxID=690887 RepID=A0A6A5YDK3_9PLEO|nr:hypothetical protein BDV96DRAFT_657660 [Lophiotrema nucula]
MSLFDSLMAEVSNTKATSRMPAPVKPKRTRAKVAPQPAKPKQPAAYKPVETNIAGYRQVVPVEKKSKPVEKKEDDTPAHEIEGRERKRPGQGKRPGGLALSRIDPYGPPPKAADLKGKKRAREDDDDEQPTSPSRKIKTEHEPDEEAFTRLFGKSLDGDGDKPAAATKSSSEVVRLPTEQLGLTKHEAQMMSTHVAAREDLTAKQKEDFEKLGLPEPEPQPEPVKAKAKEEKIEPSDSEDEDETVEENEEPVDLETAWNEEFGQDPDPADEKRAEETQDIKKRATTPNDDSDWAAFEASTEETAALSKILVSAASDEPLAEINASAEVARLSNTVTPSGQRTVHATSTSNRKRAREVDNHDERDVSTRKKKRIVLTEAAPTPKSPPNAQPQLPCVTHVFSHLLSYPATALYSHNAKPGGCLPSWSRAPTSLTLEATASAAMSSNQAPVPTITVIPPSSPGSRAQSTSSARNRTTTGHLAVPTASKSKPAAPSKPTILPDATPQPQSSGMFDMEVNSADLINAFKNGLHTSNAKIANIDSEYNSLLALIERNRTQRKEEERKKAHAQRLLTQLRSAIGENLILTMIGKTQTGNFVEEIAPGFDFVVNATRNRAERHNTKTDTLSEVRMPPKASKGGSAPYKSANGAVTAASEPFKPNIVSPAQSTCTSLNGSPSAVAEPALATKDSEPVNPMKDDTGVDVLNKPKYQKAGPFGGGAREINNIPAQNDANCKKASEGTTTAKSAIVTSEEARDEENEDAAAAAKPNQKECKTAKKAVEANGGEEVTGGNKRSYEEDEEPKAVKRIKPTSKKDDDQTETSKHTVSNKGSRAPASTSIETSSSAVAAKGEQNDGTEQDQKPPARKSAKATSIKEHTAVSAIQKGVAQVVKKTSEREQYEDPDDFINDDESDGHTSTNEDRPLQKKRVMRSQKQLAAKNQTTAQKNSKKDKSTNVPAYKAGRVGISKYDGEPSDDDTVFDQQRQSKKPAQTKITASKNKKAEAEAGDTAIKPQEPTSKAPRSKATPASKTTKQSAVEAREAMGAVTKKPPPTNAKIDEPKTATAQADADDDKDLEEDKVRGPPPPAKEPLSRIPKYSERGLAPPPRPSRREVQSRAVDERTRRQQEDAEKRAYEAKGTSSTKRSRRDDDDHDHDASDQGRKTVRRRVGDDVGSARNGRGGVGRRY